MGAHRTKSAVALVAFVILALLSCTKAQEASAPVDSVSASTDYTQLVSSAVEVRLGTLRPTIETSGTLQSQFEVVVRSRSAGTITSIDFELGDVVAEGQRLVGLDDTIARLSLDQVEKQVENSRKEVASNEQLYERGAISLNQLNLSKAALAGLEAQLARSRDAVRDVRLTSPIAGRVAEKSPALVVGDALQVGQVIGRIVDLDHLRITLSVGQSQVFLIREGARATITIAVPNQPVVTEGTVRAISAGSDARTGSWTVLVDFDNPDPSIIRSGLSAQVSIEHVDAPLHPIVPNAAIVNREGKTYVYVLEQDNARLVEISIIDRHGDNSAVKAVDDSFDLTRTRVLTTALSRITDGSSVVTQYRQGRTE